MSNQTYFSKRTPTKIADVVVQSNQLTLAKYNLDLIDKRILYLIIDRVRRRYIEDKIDANTKVDIFGNMQIQFKPSELKEIDNLNRMYPRLNAFREKSIQIDNEEEWVTVGLVNYAKHLKAKNVYELEISKELLPHLVELTSNFTSYSMSVALSFNSQYTQRFYELCQMWRSKGYFFYSIDGLREFLDCNNLYSSYGDFNRRIIQKAQKELENSFKNGISELYFTYEPKSKTGKKNNRINELSFYIHESEITNTLNWQVSDFQYNIRVLITSYFLNDKAYINRVITGIKDVNIGNIIWERLNDKKQYYLRLGKSINEIAKIFRNILLEDFNLS